MVEHTLGPFVRLEQPRAKCVVSLISKTDTNGDKTQVDAAVWCIEFRPALDHLKALHVLDDYGRVDVDGDALFAIRASGWLDMATGPAWPRRR